MTHSQRLAQVRECFCQVAAADLDQSRQTVAIERESILIRDEFLCGRRIDCGTHRGVWFIEQDELKVHRASGELVAVYRGTEIDGQLESAESDQHILKMPGVGAQTTSQSENENDSVRRAA